MNSNLLFRMCSKRILFPVISRSLAAYKVVKRPDPKTLKMPAPGSAPSLMEILKEKIRLNGPVTVAEYMHIIITNPTEGYYMKKDVIGESGDFITSPEISQLFGEIMAIWFYSESQKMCSSKPLHIVELGPGNATLLLDMLRVLHRLGYKSKHIILHLVEISSTMQTVQANRLCITHRPVDLDMKHNYEGETASGIKVYWYNDLKKVPNNFAWYIAHEFFDVLPIHKFEKTPEGWREVLIDLEENGKLRYRISVNETTSSKVLIVPPLDTGDRAALEISPRSLGLARQLAARVDEFGGIALIADYGHEGEKGDTFRAFHKHKIVDPLEKPGECDLTADVDFSQLRSAVAKTANNEHYALVLGPVTQKDFLERSQAEIRLQVLLDHAKTDAEKEKIRSAYDMLVNPTKMGDRFKFMAFYPSGAAELLEKYPPLGFSTPPKS